MNELDVVVGIYGHFCSGKSTLANTLRKSYGFKLRGFAWSLKEDLEGLTGRRITPANKVVFRPALQAYGELMRQLHGEYYWVNRLVAFTKEHDYSRFVVDDVRHASEVAGLRKFAGEKAIIIKLEVSPEVQGARYYARYGRLPTEAELNHISETALDDMPDHYFDLIVDGELPAGRVVINAVTGINQLLDVRRALAV